jgi:hypothetical protein
MAYNGPASDYSEEKAAKFCDLLRTGKRPAWAAQLCDASRQSFYNWRKQHPDFAEQWDEAVAYATEQLETLLYDLALAGDLDAIKYYLRQNKPLQYDRDNLIRLAMLQAQMATRGRTTDGFKFELDADGLPTSVPIDGQSNSWRKVLILPDNGRDRKPDPIAVAPTEPPGASTSEPSQPEAPTASPEPPLQGDVIGPSESDLERARQITDAHAPMSRPSAVVPFNRWKSLAT